MKLGVDKVWFTCYCIGMKANNGSGHKLIELLVKDAGSMNKAAKRIGVSRQFLAMVRGGERSISEDFRRAVYSAFADNRKVVNLIRKLHDESLYENV